MGAQRPSATGSNTPTTNEHIALLPLSSTTSETSVELGAKKVRRDFDCVTPYEFYTTLRAGNAVKGCQWYLNITGDNEAIKAVKKFHGDFKKLKESSSIVDAIVTIEKTFLEFRPKTVEWNIIREYFKQARENNDPSLVIKACTVSQDFSGYINRASAANTYHALKLYCTMLNCPILARTQEYTEAITSIFFHPKLKLVDRKITVYRGIVLEDKTLVENYEEGATIITTTFLSTSTNPAVASLYNAGSFEDKIAISCTYNINNTKRRTALNVASFSEHPDEEEIIILRYIPFTIKSIERTDNGRRMIICFDECNDE